jgi:fructose-6-phosphate aldolase 2
VQVVADIAHIFESFGFATEVLAASFKNVDQVQKCCLVKAHAVTVSEDVFDSLTKHPLTDWSVNKFVEDWEAGYGKGTKVSNA